MNLQDNDHDLHLEQRKRRSEERRRLRLAFGRRMGEARRSRRLTQDELAAAIDVRPWMISRYELGHSAPRLEVLVRLRGALGVTLDFLLVGLPEVPQSGQTISTVPDHRRQER